MPVSIKELSNGLGIGYIFEGRVTGQDLIRGNKELISMLDSSTEKTKEKKYVLIDQTPGKSFDYTPEELRIILEQDREMLDRLGKDLVIAIASSTSLHYGFARMWEIHTNNWGWEVKVFRNRDRKKAETWIRDRVKEKSGIELSLPLA